MTERVQKVLSQWGIASRRQAEKMIVAKRVKIDGQIAKLGDKVDVETNVLQVDGKVVKVADRPKLLYLLLNKPPGVVSTCFDPQNRSTVIDLLPVNLKQGTGIHPVGRLDFASSGALILTNDGKLTLGLTHPRYHLPKTYIVELDRPPSNRDLALWRKGIILDGKKTLPATISLVAPNKKIIEIVLREGRNRQIRRAAQQLGYQVKKLHRIAVGSITLSLGNNLELTQGKYRHLKQGEIYFLKNSYIKSLKVSAQPRSAVYD